MYSHFFDGLFGNDEPVETSIKIALIGDGSTGKTSYFNRIVSGDSTEYRFSKNYDATQGCNICQIEMMIGKHKVTVHIFDTAGQEKFGMLRDSYLMGADGIILMYDVMDLGSKQNVITKWLPEIKKIMTKTRMSNIPVAVVGNKCDRIDRRKHIEKTTLGFRVSDLVSNYDARQGMIEQHMISVKGDEHLMTPIIWLLQIILKKNCKNIKKTEKKPFISYCNK